MIRRVALLLTVWLAALWAILSPCPLLALTVTNVAGCEASGATSVSCTTSAATVSGAQIFTVYAIGGTNNATISVTDSASHTYTEGTQLNGSSNIASVAPFWVLNASVVANGGSITGSQTGGSSGNQYLSGASISGVATSNALDAQAAGTTSTGTTPSISTGVLAQANEIVIGWILIHNGSGDTFTEAPGFTTGGTVTGGSPGAVRWAYEVVSSTSSVTYAPTLGTSEQYWTNVLSFKCTTNPCTIAVAPLLPMLGVGANDNEPWWYERRKAG